MNLTRTVQQTQYLELEKCPNCNKNIIISDCGYSSFNPGRAQCNFCGMKWELGFVDDSWSAGVKWNNLCSSINKCLKVFSLLQVKEEMSKSRDFAQEDDESEAKILREQLRYYILSGK